MCGVTGKLRLLWIQRAQLYSCVNMLEPTVAFSLPVFETTLFKIISCDLEHDHSLMKLYTHKLKRAFICMLTIRGFLSSLENGSAHQPIVEKVFDIK